MCRPESFLKWPLIITCLKTSFNDAEKSDQCKQSWSRWACGWLVVWAPLRRANEIFCRNSKNFFLYEGVFDQYLTLPKEIILFCFTIKVLFANFKLLTVWSLSRNICESDSNTCSRINFQDKKIVEHLKNKTWMLRRNVSSGPRDSSAEILFGNCIFMNFIWGAFWMLQIFSKTTFAGPFWCNFK